MRKILFVLSLVFASVILISCSNPTIDIDAKTVTVEVGDTYQIDASASDDGDLMFESSDTSILTISDTGLISAIKAGEATVTVSLKSDEDVSVDINVSVVLTHYVETDDSELVVVADHMIDIDYDASSDVDLTSSDPSVFVIEDGKVKGISEGVATLTIALQSDASIKQEITITVTKNVMLSIVEPLEQLYVGEQRVLAYESNDDVTFESSDETIATIGANGMLDVLAVGEVTISVISTYDTSIKASMTFDVLDAPTSLEIVGDDQMMIDDMSSLSVNANESAYEGVYWSSSNEEIATINTLGEITALQPGSVTFTATSMADDDITATHEMEILNAVVVKSDAVEGDTYTYQDFEYVYGQRLYTSISQALENISENTLILLTDGLYDELIEIDVNGTTLKAIGTATISSIVSIDADDVTLSELCFVNQGRVLNTDPIKNFTLSRNEVTELQSLDGAFMSLHHVDGLIIDNNNFYGFMGQAIQLDDVMISNTEITHNQFTNITKAFAFDYNTPSTLDAELLIERNIITQVVDAMDILIDESVKVNTYIRFNEVSAYSGYALYAMENNDLDATLNYWGSETLDMQKFVNLNEMQLRGYYDNPSDIIDEEDFDPEIPVKILPDQEEIDMILGEEAQITFTVLPTTASTSRVKFITSDSDTLRINTEGELNPLTSGQATITLRLSSDFSINAEVVVNITTTPGIELKPDMVSSGVEVGDLFLLEATPFPLDIEDADVTLTSSDPLIATIDQLGVVEAKQAGLVTFTATLDDDPSVTQTFTIDIHDTLDDNDLLDLLTQYQVSYTTPHEWIAYGTSYNYYDFKYESVSKYYFGDIEINQSKLLDISPGIRPGEPFDDLPDGVTQYNPYNVYWVVVHDTANTSTGAGALSHANYLWNAASNGTQLWTSWHFSIDDKEIYQQLPETERGYHAGDGSSQPLQGSTYLGGGNRNGIGIEMGVNDDADVYRTWQRTAKLVSQLLTKYDLPRENMKYHNDFSGKDCPKTLRNAGLIPLFEEFQDIEYKVADEFSDATITFESHNPHYLDNTGRIIDMPDRAMTVSYTVTVTQNGESVARTFYSYLPGTVH